MFSSFLSHFFSLSLTSSATFHLRGLLPASLSSQGSRVPRAKRRCGHWVVFHKVRSQVEVGLGSWFDPETRALIQVFHSGRAFLSLSALAFTLLTGARRLNRGGGFRAPLSRPHLAKTPLKPSPCSKKTLCDTLVKVLFMTAPLPARAPRCTWLRADREPTKISATNADTVMNRRGE